jgi:hypothetical protein
LDAKNETLNTIFAPKKYTLRRIDSIYIFVQQCRCRAKDFFQGSTGKLAYRQAGVGLEKGESDEQL